MHQVGVIGAGTMGHGIAQVCAMAGMSVNLTDRDPSGLERGLVAIRANLQKGVDRGKVTAEAMESALGRVRAVPWVEACVHQADIVIEAVPEVLDIKQSLFKQVEPLVRPDTVLGTNTSSLSIAAIGSVLNRPERLIGTHFFNPVHIMKLLEVIIAKTCSDDTVARIQEFGTQINKEVILVRDVPGFATSRLGVALGMEAIRMLESGVASAEDIDKAMVLGYRHPIGPLKLTDLVGLDVRLKIGEYLAQELDNPAFIPPQLMRDMVERGELGKKSGQGFYTW